MLWGLFPNKVFRAKDKETALFAKEVYSHGTRPEKKGPFDAVFGRKSYLETAPGAFSF